MKPLKILFWTPQYLPDIGGIEVLAEQTVAALKQKGMRIHVVTSHGARRAPDRSIHRGIPVDRFRFSQALAYRDVPETVRICRRLRTLKNKFRPDVVHIHFGLASITYFHVKTNDEKTPTLLTLHGSFQKAAVRKRTVMAAAIDQTNWFTGVSKSAVSDLRRLHSSVKKRSSLVYNGQPSLALQPSKLPFDSPVLLCVGRLVRDKGFDVALKAMKYVITVFPSAQLWIAGDGPANAELKTLVKRLKLQRHVRFLGEVAPANVAKLINQSTLVVVPSRCREGLPLVAVQAAQMGRPVVASNEGGLKEVIRNGQTGELIPKENPTALAKAVCTLLKNQKRARAMGLAARQRQQTFFGWNAYISSYERLYRKLAKNR